MSIHFHPLLVKEIKKETPDCVSVQFDIPEQLKDSFTYKQGQFRLVYFDQVLVAKLAHKII